MSGELSSEQLKLMEAFVDALKVNPNGMRQSQLHLIGAIDKVDKMAPVINYLIRIKRIKVLQRGNELIDPLFRIIDEEKFEKIKDLKAAEVQIYEIIEESGSSGIWIRDIKTALGNAIHTNQVQKHLTVLQQKSLVKKITAVSSKSRKHYILSEFTPATTVTGGPWYTDGEFDSTFVNELQDILKSYIESSKPKDTPHSAADLLEKLTHVDNILDSSVNMTEKDITCLLNNMVYDGTIEEATPSSELGQKATVRYKKAKNFKAEEHLSMLPCGICPVASQCHEDGEISPATCLYLPEWVTIDYRATPMELEW